MALRFPIAISVAEAEYSHNLVKPLISLSSEHGFKPAGWLDKVSAGRTVIDFSGHIEGKDLERQSTQLLKEVKYTMRQAQPKE